MPITPIRPLIYEPGNLCFVCKWQVKLCYPFVKGTKDRRGEDREEEEGGKEDAHPT